MTDWLLIIGSVDVSYEVQGTWNGSHKKVFVKVNELFSVSFQVDIIEDFHMKQRSTLDNRYIKYKVVKYTIYVSRQSH